MIEAKSVFERLSVKDVQEARKRANPYETISGAIFQNRWAGRGRPFLRAAMKMANLDRVFDWKLSGEADATVRRTQCGMCGEPRNLRRDEEPFYFADVCAGPGGFSEYMLWRKGFYNSKGFGFTLRGRDDFKLHNFKASSAASFETFYGETGDGNVYLPQNLG